jgi:rubrerythrin
MVKLSDDALKFLNLGIEAELMAYVFYKKVLNMLKEEDLKKIIEKFAHDEKDHFLQLENEYDKNVRSEMWAPYKDIMRKEGLPEIDEYISETHEELLKKIGKLKTKREIFEMALSLEKEAYALYEKSYNKVVEPEAKKIFDHLRHFEMGHVRTVERALKNL